VTGGGRHPVQRAPASPAAGPHPWRLYAHRGSCRVFPENSLEAFQCALDDGADALELDVHGTADGHLVVAHDPDGGRVAGDPRPIRVLELAEVRRWRLLRTDTRVPTLEAVVRAFPGVPMSIDLKPDRPALVAPLVALLEELGATGWVTLASFHHRVMRAVHASTWQGQTALSRFEVAVLRSAPLGLARRFVRGRAAQVPRAAGPFRLDDNRFLGRCRRLGLRADYWVVNDPDEARALLARGATGIMTDDPARLAPVVRQLRAERRRQTP
jgi:glycerophosphoryl diester phosphodiesterase